MPAPKKITITVTPMASVPPYTAGATFRADNGFWISVDDDQADLSNVDEGHGGGNPNAHVKWKIDTAGWEFPAQGGIVIANPGQQFTNVGRDQADHKFHHWKREKKDNFTDPNDRRYWYKYTITVSNAAGTISVVYDPWVINR
jgi:hypothetical protein